MNHGSPTSSCSARRSRSNRGTRAQGGFTIVEVLVALVMSVAGIAGVIGMLRSGNNAASFSRRTTEATMLGESTLEALITSRVGSSTTAEIVNARGQLVAGSPYTRTWTVIADPALPAVSILPVNISGIESDGLVKTLPFSSRVRR